MRTPDELAKSIGDAGMDGSGKVVVYDSGSLEATMLYAALRRIGHRNVAVLDGGIEGWEEAGYHLATGTAAAVKSGTFEVRADDSVLAGNAEVAAALESKDAVVVDVRPIAQHIGLRKHPLAHRAGRIEGTVNLSVRAFWSVEGYLKDPASVAWLLESSGITRDKTIIVTCNTSQAASGAFYYLEYLGYEKAKIHDGSYVNWEQAGTSAKATPVPPPVKKAPVKAPEPEEEEEDKFGC
jgi:thiosulfate/3-mercaptopyruvate sulfurtransferase